MTLNNSTLNDILQKLPNFCIAVLGDLFLDRYLDIDAALTEPSLETGLDAYQVTRVRSHPGAAGTVINNLAALGVGRIVPLSVLGDDGEGYELRQALRRLASVDAASIWTDPTRRTPTYAKPMLCQTGTVPRELNRLDIKNRTALGAETQSKLLSTLEPAWIEADALLVLDQVSESDCGVVTAKVRERLCALAEQTPNKVVLADSRERIGLFRNVCSKPNARECRHAMGLDDVREAAGALARTTRRPVFCTCGEDGILIADPHGSEAALQEIPAYPVTGPIDPVGAGDSVSAGIACALAAGASLSEAAAFGNLVASITIQQIGVTGSATPQEVRQRWNEVNS
ncbi:MAG: PfkB family carbohydrate kinase [Gemmataceae bacterium]|nr:PfkB family carbohydrate kinase [Gemmataceae bacterium]MCI0741353.1 PfkB family carbohydrate kinase [Gemmataceae bacterium]